METLNNYIKQLINASEKHDNKKITQICRDMGKKRKTLLLEVQRLGKFPSDGGALIIAQDKQIFLSVFVLKPDQRTAIHDHGSDTWVTILSGCSRNTEYQLDKQQVATAVSSTICEPGHVYHLTGDRPHDDMNVAEEHTIQLHFYPMDVLKEEIHCKRSLWDFKHRQRHPYSHDLFFKLSSEAGTVIEENIHVN